MYQGSEVGMVKGPELQFGSTASSVRKRAAKDA